MLASWAALTACSKETKISVTDNTDVYKLDAKFDDSRTAGVREYINDFYKPTQVIPLASGEVNHEVTLPDQTKFWVESSEGELHLKFDKKANSAEAYTRIQAFSKGLGSVATGK